jgi:hypothetical protein
MCFTPYFAFLFFFPYSFYVTEGGCNDIGAQDSLATISGGGGLSGFDHEACHLHQFVSALVQVLEGP